ncbi:uncharacterized protein LOC102808831, partial [Saccoglossus kowalevskii]|uniref:Uncharacterized protein LOC102808831 n=1 Tax=Saccoglossus kowalevskii TaxID=10224 RepID=A0ABM0M6A6_SACKO
MIRNVPLSRRHNDSFCVTGPTLLKTKTVPFHTRPFLWDPVQRAQTSLLLEPSQRNKFKEEENLLEEVRGLKRKREVIPHRIEYGDLTVGGINTRLNERMDYGEELQKIKALPQIPPQCQELYTGRGIKLPPSHSSNRQPLTKIVSAPMPALRKTASFAVQTEDPMLQEREDKQEHFKVQPPAKIKRQSSIVRKSVKRKDSISLKPEKEPKTQMENEHMEDDEIPKEPSVEVTINEHDTMETEDIPPSPPPPED